MRSGDALLDHLFRRVGFGASAADLQAVAGMSYNAAVDYFVDFDKQPDDVDTKIGLPDSVAITTRGQFSPNTNIDDARQRWLFRMVHTRRPLQEKMALFWHNHFGVGYTKVAGTVGGVLGTKMMATKGGELPGPQGHYELLRQGVLGKFRDLLIEVAKDPAMLVFLDGRTNTKAKPQENFGREVMELFTWGLGHYTESDVYAAARVFTGWNLRNVPGANANDPAGYQEFIYNAAQHDVAAKTFTFPIRRIQHDSRPRHGVRHAGRDRFADVTGQSSGDGSTTRGQAVELLRQRSRRSRSRVHRRGDQRLPPERHGHASGPPLHPAAPSGSPIRATSTRATHGRRSSSCRTMKEIGFAGFSVDSARVPLTNMGQTLFEPPNVAGWQLGRAWFGTGAMLARMNFAAAVASNQKFNLARSFSATERAQPDRVLNGMLQRLTPAPYTTAEMNEMLTYLNTGGAWTGNDTQMNAKAPGLARLVAGSGEYQFV